MYMQRLAASQDAVIPILFVLVFAGIALIAILLGTAVLAPRIGIPILIIVGGIAIIAMARRLVVGGLAIFFGLLFLFLVMGGVI